MTYKDKCGGCKYHRIRYENDRLTGSVCIQHYTSPVKITERKCGHYKPLGFEPANGTMCYADFYIQCSKFFKEKMVALGYEIIDMCDLTQDTRPGFLLR